MKILGIESSSLVASAAIVTDDELTAEYTVNFKKTHSQTLLPMIDEIVRMVGLDLGTLDASLLVLGNTKSAMFPMELLPYTERHTFGTGAVKINFLVNYSFEWDLGFHKGAMGPAMRSSDVSRVDLIIRWGGRRRLSGFLPVQSVYSDMYVIDDYWPDFTARHVYDAIDWYSKQDITLGG